MNQEEVKGKWEHLKGNVKNAIQKVKKGEGLSNIKDEGKKDFSKVREGVKEKTSEIKPGADKMRSNFTNAQKPDKNIPNENRT